nr:lysyl oxidase family protein [Motilibacter aurantiacus]
MLDHPTHNHWHLDAMAKYALLDPETGRAVVSADKVSFCLRDNRRVPGATGRVEARHYGTCGRARVQGVAVGWADVYGHYLPGQALRLPRSLPDGGYCLLLEADPDGLLLETDEKDNAAVLPVRIVEGTRVGKGSAALCRGVLSSLRTP